MEGIGEKRLEVSISKDELKAEITIRASQSPMDVTVTEQEVRQALEQSGITYGIIEQAIEQLCQSPQKYVNQPLLIAVGLPPVPGTDAKIEYPYEKKETDEHKPKELDDGRVDYYSLNTIANISKGQLIAQKIPATAGEAGMSVKGIKIPAKAGKEVTIKAGKNVVFNQDRTLLYAAIDGQVSFTDKDKVNVFPIYEVNGDVDFSVGNIDFIGNVIIRGSVPTGFRIKASGDIRVLGNVEGAELEAGGSIEIKSGIVAQEKGFVKAGRDVRTSFIQNGNVTAGNEIFVSQSIMFSNVRAGKNIFCNGAKGIIIGGTLQAGEQIVARVIGNSSSTPTVLEVGVKPELREELVQLKRQIQVAYENMRKTEQGLNVLSQILAANGELSPDKKALQVKLANTRLVLEKELKTHEARKKELEIELEGETPAKIEASTIMYPGIKLVFGNLVRFIKQEISRARFMVIQGEITTVTIV